MLCLFVLYRVSGVSGHCKSGVSSSYVVFGIVQVMIPVYLFVLSPQSPISSTDLLFQMEALECTPASFYGNMPLNVKAKQAPGAFWF